MIPGTIDMITVRGTGEPFNTGRVSGLLADVTRRLPAGRFRCYDLDYPAGIGPINAQLRMDGLSLEQNVEIGINNLVATIRATPNIVGILAYSLGGIVVSRFLERLHRGEWPDLVVAFAGFVSNPLRRAGDSIGNIAPGYGIAGQHGHWPPSVRTWEVANPNDGITACPDSNPLRWVFPAIDTFTFADGGGWNQQYIDDLTEVGWKATADWSNPMEAWRQFGTAIHLVGGYMAPFPYNQHSGYGHFRRPDSTRTYTADLAARITEFVGGAL